MRLSETLPRDLAASLVVFLVAIPLCLGIAIASGAPVEMGLVSGIVGGLVVGLIAGSPLQVTGPAAGLAVIVFAFIQEHGIAMLGPVLIAAGALQILAGLAGIGAWFRAISPAVVHGMLAGIGVLIVLGQVHVLMGARPAAGAIENVAAMDETLGRLAGAGHTAEGTALLVGLIALLAMLGWEKVRPAALALLPGALVGVAAGTLLTAALDLPIPRVDLPDSLFAGFALPGAAEFAGLARPSVLIATLVIAVIASAETLLSAAAVDRMHEGPRTRFNRELCAQGIGNGLCGLLGGLPITGVIVRSSANVQAGARTRASAVLHGAWILALVALAPALLERVPLTALAAVLIVTGWRLVALRHVRELLDHHGVLPVAIWGATVTLVVVEDLLIGVGVGLALSLIEILPHRRRRLAIRRAERAGTIQLGLRGAATCRDVPALLGALESLPEGQRVRLVDQGLRYIDHTSAETISDWLRREARAGRPVEIQPRRALPHPRVGSSFARFSAELA